MAVGRAATDEGISWWQVDQQRNRLVVSNRRAVVETRLTNLEPGQLVTGIVRSLKPYGAFVDIGGVSGLLHISQISHDHISDVAKVLSEGQEVKAMILTQVCPPLAPASWRCCQSAPGAASVRAWW